MWNENCDRACDNIDNDNEYEAENEEREEMAGTQKREYLANFLIIKLALLYKALILLTIKLFALYIIIKISLKTILNISICSLCCFC